jgi:uncharacterized protein (DUF58 family)
MVARPTLVLAAALLLAGAAFDSPSLYVPAIGLALLAAGSRLWVVLAARSLRVEQEPGPWSIHEGDPYPIHLLIGTGRVPLPGGRAVHPLADRSRPVGLRRPRRVLLEVPSLRRGRRHLEPAAVRLSDPLGLSTVEVGGASGDQVLVLPRVEPVVWHGDPGGGTGEGADGVRGLGPAGLDTRPLDFEVDGVRPYRQGSPASRIHWPTVARIGEMVEHRLVAGGGSAPLVVLDSSVATDDDALDRAVRAAASLCVHLARSGGCALLLSGERGPLEVDPKLRAWPVAHARLAVVEAGGPAPAVARGSRGEGIFWVTAAAPAPPPTRGPGGARSYVVTPSLLPGPPPAFSVAGCHGQRLDLVESRDAGAATAPATSGEAV